MIRTRVSWSRSLAACSVDRRWFWSSRVCSARTRPRASRCASGICHLVTASTPNVSRQVGLSLACSVVYPVCCVLQQSGHCNPQRASHGSQEILESNGCVWSSDVHKHKQLRPVITLRPSRPSIATPLWSRKQNRCGVPFAFRLPSDREFEDVL